MGCAERQRSHLFSRSIREPHWSHKLSEGVKNHGVYYSHDLFVSLIEADRARVGARIRVRLFSRSIREPHWSHSLSLLMVSGLHCYSHDLFVSLIEAKRLNFSLLLTKPTILTIYSWASLKLLDILFNQIFNFAILTIYSWASLKHRHQFCNRFGQRAILTIYSWASLKRW